MSRVASDGETRGGPGFPTTRGSFLEDLSSGTPLERARAFERLASSYWKPMYKYVRLRFGRRDEDARDLVQAFLARALEDDWLARFDARRGRFRPFLRLSLEGFVLNEDKARSRLKRGGERALLSLDFEGAEAELAGVVAPGAEALEQWFEAEWRRGFLAEVLAEFEAELARDGHALRARVFRAYDLPDDPARRPTYAELARACGTSESDVTNQLAAARRGFRERVLARLRRETSDEDEFRRDLATLLGGTT